MDLSVIIPVRDEEESVSELVRRLSSTLAGLNIQYEIIFVTDLNRDKTFEVLKAYCEKDSKINVIKLANSYGQHIAIIAGLNFCKGNFAVIMDGDLQDYPEDIPKLYARIQEGYDIVYGIKERKNDSFLRNLSSRLFVGLMNRLSDVKLDYNTSMFRIISRRTVNEVLRFKERLPSLTFIMSLIGFPYSEIQVSSGRRKAGKTKYDVFRLFNFGISSLIAFSTKPIRLISMLGFLVSGLSFFYMCIVMIQKLFFTVSVLGWSTTVFLITFLGGIQLFVMGIIGEYIARIFIETKNRPLYSIEEKVGNVD